VRDPNDPLARVTYFILLQWRGDRLVGIRDFRYARYVADDAEIIITPTP
jgi:RNA polymerase sigma-70 factor, ECF subfamily